MYQEFFDLREHPFRLTPDADFLYLSAQHARAKACIEQASVKSGAFVIVTGDIGCGKSVLVNRVLAEMPKSVAVARITQTHLEIDEFLQSLLSQFGFRPFDRSKAALRSLLDNFLFAQSVRKQSVLLIIEEAQNLTRPLLRELCALADVEEDEQKLMSVLLVGQPLLGERLGEPELKRISAQARCTVHLEPLDRKDTRRLIEHRLTRAGCAETPFEDDTYEAIYRHTGGVPRLIINLCDTALTAAYVEESKKVTPAILQTAIDELELEAVDGSAASKAGAGEAEQAPERAVLRISLKGKPLEECEVCDTRVMIGRDSANDIVLYGPFISRHHAQIAMDPDGAYWIIDLNSTNGVFVNRRRVQRRRLYDGDLIQMGQHELAYSRAGDVDTSSPADINDFRSTSVLDDDEAEDDQIDRTGDYGNGGAAALKQQPGDDEQSGDDAEREPQPSSGHS